MSQQVPFILLHALAAAGCRLFQYSPKRLLDEVPTMFAFPKLSTIFSTIADRIPATVRTGESTDVQQHGGAAVLPVSSARNPKLQFCGRVRPPYVFRNIAAGARVASVQRSSGGVTVTDESGHSAQVSTMLASCNSRSCEPPPTSGGPCLQSMLLHRQQRQRQLPSKSSGMFRFPSVAV